MQQNEIDKMIKALIRDQKFATSEEIWPVDALRVEPLFADEFAKKVREIMKVTSEKGIEEEKVFESFRNPSRIWKFMPVVLQGSKVVYDKKVRVKIAKFLLKALHYLTEGDIYYEERKNTISIYKKEESLPLFQPSNNMKKIVSKLIATLWQYAEALFYLEHNAGKEIHGPYDHEQGKLIVRDYFDLKPIELWPNVLQNFPYESVKLITVYKGVDFSFDIFNNYTIQGSPREDLTNVGLALSKEGKESTSEIEELQNLLTKIVEKTTELSDITNNYSEEEKMSTHIECCFYNLKNTCDLLGIDWRVDESIYTRVEEIGLLPPPDPDALDKEKLKRNFDPRDDFLPWRELFEQKIQ